MLGQNTRFGKKLDLQCDTYFDPLSYSTEVSPEMLRMPKGGLEVPLRWRHKLLNHFQEAYRLSQLKPGRISDEALEHFFSEPDSAPPGAASVE